MNEEQAMNEAAVERLRRRMEKGLHPNIVPLPIDTEGLKALLAGDLEEVEVDNWDREGAASLAEERGKPDLARLIRGKVTPQELADEGMQKALVEYAESIGGVVVDSHEDGTRDSLALQRALGTALHNNLKAAPQLQPIEQRIEGLLAQINERMQRVEEEVMFTSSANRFAHLRSGIEHNTIPHLPPAPDWNTLEAYVGPFLRDIVDNIQGAPILRERATVSGILPSSVLKGVDVVGEELLQIVRERGRAYGEEAILAMGEAGMVGMIVAKVMRLMWSHRGGMQFMSRRDSYIDLAGYCLLTIALDQYITEQSAKEE